MDNQNKGISPLARVELEALEAGREWIRNKIEHDLRELAEQQGDLPPLSNQTSIRSRPPRHEKPLQRTPRLIAKGVKAHGVHARWRCQMPKVMSIPIDFSVQLREA